MKKKAIAVIYSPKSLLDFIWYYSSFGDKYDWDVIIKTYGEDYDKSNLNSIQTYAKKTGIFENIIIDTDNEIFQSVADKVKLFLQMMSYYITKKQKSFCKKYINQRFKLEDYSLILLTCDSGTLEGVIIGVSDEYNVVILEDGVGDYSEKKEKFDRKDLLNFWNLIGYMLAKMGYANTHFSHYKLEKTKYCQKYATHPELMKNLNFKNILKLNDMSVCDMQLYQKILEKIYVFPKDIKNVDMVLFTSPMADFVENEAVIVDKVQNYIKNNFQEGKLFLKKHPRDSMQYDFGSSIEIVEIEKMIPAEILLRYFDVKECIFTFPSNILFEMDFDECDIKILHFCQMPSEKYKSFFDVSIETMNIGVNNIVELR